MATMSFAGGSRMANPTHTQTADSLGGQLACWLATHLAALAVLKNPFTRLGVQRHVKFGTRVRLADPMPLIVQPHLAAMVNPARYGVLRQAVQHALQIPVLTLPSPTVAPPRMRQRG